MLIMYNGEISLRGISLRNPSQTREERGLAPGGGERWTGQRRALNELGSCQKVGFEGLSCDGRGDDQSERQTDERVVVKVWRYEYLHRGNLFEANSLGKAHLPGEGRESQLRLITINPWTLCKLYTWRWFGYVCMVCMLRT